MDVISDNAFVVLELRDPLLIEAEIIQKEIFISTTDISIWNLPSILTSQIVKVQADRNRLTQESSYFRSLLKGNFSESCLDCISIEWNLETIIDVLKSIYGCQLDITSHNFLPHLELEWEYVAAIDFIPELCTKYLARNFMWAISCNSFVDVPYNLLLHCVEHPHLTVDSEKDLVEALLVWLDSNIGQLECSSTSIKDDYIDILKKVRVRLLPLWFAAGKKRSCYFSELAEESISAVLGLIRDASMSLLCVLRDGEYDTIRIRLTDYTKRINLSGCSQITSALLLLSIIPCSYDMNPTSRKGIIKSQILLEHLDVDQYPIPQNLFSTSSFEAVREVDLSKCPGVHLETAIKGFCKSFPSLKTFKASYCLHFNMKALFHLVQNCPLVNEVDLTADISPAIPSRVSTISTSFDGHQDVDVASYKMLKERSLTSNIKKLKLEGRSDINDFDLITISVLSGSLSYLNIKGCTSVTDVGISKLICKCLNLHSIVVSDTYFGRNSILALCSDFPSSDSVPGVHHEQKHSASLAFRLQKLHVGGCKSVDVTSLIHLMSHIYTLKSLCLRGTALVDDAFYNFLGSSLERLDVSDTMVSGAALAHIIRRNPGLKFLKSRGCSNFCHCGSNLDGSALPYQDLSSGCSKGEELYAEIGRTCLLEDVAFGWGFSSFSLENLGPAISSLRAITVGLGASLNQSALMLLPKICPLLESVVLNFQVISDRIVKNIVESLSRLQVLGLCYCLGDFSSISFILNMPNLRILRLERVTPWMTNDDLIILTQNCASLIELSLSGCRLLNSDSQQIISCGWPGLISIHLEDCGEITSNGVSSIFDCKAMEDLSLRHNGRGIQRRFIVDAASKMPMLRKVALDLCDASEGGFDSLGFADRFYLSIVKIARCKRHKCAFDFPNLDSCRSSVHEESIVLEWNSKGLRTTVVKERV